MCEIGKSLFAIRCESESRSLLSSKMESEAWDSLGALVEFLERDESPSVRKALFSWRYQQAYLANAKETYAWRKVIDSIKVSDLGQIGSELNKEGKTALSLVESKPIMLRVAGEVTNALLHSYNNRHKITFFQCDSKEPF